MKKTIFVVEDDPAIQELYTLSLENEFNCRCFDEGNSFFDSLLTENPDLILLDVMLPGMDGFAILSRLKDTPSTEFIPVIMVSAKSEEFSKVKGLSMGAADYMTKPFGVMELIARIKSKLCNVTKSNSYLPPNVAYKDINIDFTKYQITINKREIQTTLKEFNLLSLLCENAKTVQKRELIFKKIWGEKFNGETRVLDININEIRKKLAKADSETVIKTIRGVGYMLA
jgi:two-component system alkaline phosphatase synthesis response regulator PhoP